MKKVTIQIAQADENGYYFKGLEIEAEEIKIHPEVRFAVHQSHISFNYVVTHIESGYAFGYGGTRNKAIAHAKKRIKPYKNLKRFIQQKIKQHIKTKVA